MRTGTAVCVIALLLAPGVNAQAPKSLFFTASDGTRIHYFDIAGNGSPVVLIHGYTANAEGKWLKSNIAQTLAKNHRVIAIDARGHGKSDKPHDPAKYGPRMAGADRAAIDAVQKYPWQPGDRDIDLRTVTVPVLAIVGSLDRPNARTHRLKRELTGAQIVIIPGETHGSVHLNHTYTSRLVKFIDAHDHP